MTNVVSFRPHGHLIVHLYEGKELACIVEGPKEKVEEVERQWKQRAKK